MAGSVPPRAGARMTTRHRATGPPPVGGANGRSPSHPPCDAGRHTPLPHHASLANQTLTSRPLPRGRLLFLRCPPAGVRATNKSSRLRVSSVLALLAQVAG